MAPLHSIDDLAVIAGQVTEAQWREVTRRLAEATVKLFELEAQVEELVEANLRLRHELSETTLALFLVAPHHDT